LQKALPNDLIDFASNDYLGFSVRNYFKDTQEYLIKINSLKKQRLVPVLSGNQKLYQAEDFIANFHQTETALIFNSGRCYYWFFSAVPQKEI
jgi:8-amino-7-oxononanoate synthase